LKTKKAIERNLEIIGEAINRILKIDNDFPIENAKNIIGTRNRIYILTTTSQMMLFGQS
jgi:uncharacterized protein with HEPN domain